MAKITTTYADRDVQYPNRYTLTNVSGTTYDLVRQEGTVNVAGTLLNKIKFDEIKTVVNGLDDYRIADETSIANLNTGWLPSGETWAYVSVDDPTGVIKINADVTTKYSLGMRIKFTNGGNIIYGILTKIGTYGGDVAGYTYLTFLHEINTSTGNSALHLMANLAITVNYYSNMKVPFGFPLASDKWSIITTDGSARTQATPTNNTWYNLGARNIRIPIGVWNLFYKCDIWGQANSGRIDLYATLSTSNNSESDTLFSVRNIFQSVSLSGLFAMYSGIITITSKTIYYLNMKIAESTSPAYLGSDGNLSKAVIRATIAYL